MLRVSDIAELDAGKIGTIVFPVPDDLTSMELTVAPDQGYWKGGKFVFSIKVPDMYPHEPPKVRRALARNTTSLHAERRQERYLRSGAA